MYHVRLKKGSFKYGSKNDKIGINLDEWLYILLSNLSFDPNGCTSLNPKCAYKPSPNFNLFLKSGTYIKTPKTTSTMFNLEEYIVKLLIFWGKMTDNDYKTYCCKYKNKLNLFKEVVYFERGIPIDKSGLIRNWLKRRLSDWGIGGVVDPCCP